MTCAGSKTLLVDGGGVFNALLVASYGKRTPWLPGDGLLRTIAGVSGMTAARGFDRKEVFLRRIGPTPGTRRSSSVSDSSWAQA